MQQPTIDPGYWFSVTCELYDKTLVYWSYGYNLSYFASYVIIGFAFLYFGYRVWSLANPIIKRGLLASGLFVIFCGIGHFWDVLSAYHKIPLVYYSRAAWQTFGALISLIVALGFALAVRQVSTNKKFVQWMREDAEAHGDDPLHHTLNGEDE